MNAGISTWMPTGICGGMLRPPGRGIYHQMLGSLVMRRLALCPPTA